MKNRAPLHVIQKLKEARVHATMEKACFVPPSSSDFLVIDRDGDQLDVNRFLKEQTRLHRETWLIPLLDDLIEWAEGS